MLLLDHTITTAKLGEPVYILPVGCVHADDPGFRESMFAKYIERVEREPNLYFLGMGDYRNFLRATARRHLAVLKAKDQEAWRDLDAMVRHEALLFYKKWLEPIKHKVIGLLEGNHHHMMTDQTTDTQYMCGLGGFPYLTDLCMIRLRIGSERRAMGVFKILLHHGDWAAGSASMSSDVGQVERKAAQFPLFDILIFSHTHRKWGMLLSPRLTIPERGELVTKEVPWVAVRTGCCVASYDNCLPHYAHKKLLPPTELGYVTLGIEFYRSYHAERYSKKKVAGSGSGNYRHKFTISY